MDKANCLLLRAACCAPAVLAVPFECAEGAIIHQSVHWTVPADDQGLVIDLERLQALSGPAALGDWHVRVFGASGLQFEVREGGAAGLMRYSLDPGKAGPGNLPLGLVVGPFSDFGSGTAAFGTGIGEWRLDGPNYFGFRFISRAGDVHYGWGRLDVGPSATSRSIVEIAWQDTPGLGLQVGHTPAAGPLVLLGIATLMGGPRRARR